MKSPAGTRRLFAPNRSPRGLGLRTSRTAALKMPSFRRSIPAAAVGSRFVAVSDARVPNSLPQHERSHRPLLHVASQVRSHARFRSFSVAARPTDPRRTHIQRPWRPTTTLLFRQIRSTTASISQSQRLTWTTRSATGRGACCADPKVYNATSSATRQGGVISIENNSNWDIARSSRMAGKIDMASTREKGR